MKLLIDIPEGLYEAYKGRPPMFGDEGLDMICQAIANGKPLDNITDEQISVAFQIAIANYWEEMSKHLTPPPTRCNCPIQENPICAEHQEERPQGEWKHNKFDEHYCNKCGSFALWAEEADGYYEVQSNFCPNCGADMRKGGAE